MSYLTDKFNLGNLLWIRWSNTGNKGGRKLWNFDKLLTFDLLDWLLVFKMSSISSVNTSGDHWGISQCPARVDIGISRSEKWNENLLHSFREVKSEMKIWFTHFENEKWNEKALRSRTRMKSEMKMAQDRDREWKVKWKCIEIEIEKWNFSRILEKFLRIKKSRKF